MAGRVLTTVLQTPLGDMVAGATDAGVCLLEFAGQRSRRSLARLEELGGTAAPGVHPHTRALERELADYFAGTRRSGFSVPVALAGTDFQERVWRALRDVPYGTTVSYAELARRTGAGSAARAVGRANGANRIAIVVPCHRVVRADGSPGGYGGGPARKRRLLDLEAGVLQML